MNKFEELNYDSIEVLIYIIKKCIRLNYDINCTKGQKLLYCCYGAVLAQFGIRLCKEHPKAWQYGPAFPRAYSAHSKNRINFDVQDPISSSKCPAYIKYVVDETITYFGKYSATVLSNWTHKENSPWYICSNNGSFLYKDISDSIIKEYFASNVLGKYEGPEYPARYN